MGVNLFESTESLFNRDIFHQLIDNSGFGIGIYDTNGVILFYNKKALENMKLSENDVIGKSILELFGSTGDEYVARINEVVKTGKSCEYEDCISLTSNNQWFVSTYSPVYDPDGAVLAVQVITIEITKQKNIEASLRESEEKFRTFSELSSVGIYCTDMNGDCTYANRKWLDMAGMKLEDALGKGWVNALHPDDREKINEKWYKSVQSNGTWGFEYRFQTPDGKICWIYGTAKEITDEDGNISGYIGNNFDITERKKLEQELVESKENLKQICSNLTQVLYIYDTEKQKFLYVSPSYEKVWEMPVEKVLDDPFAYTTIVHPDDHDVFWDACRREQENGEYFDQEYRIVMKDGRTKWIRSRNFPVDTKKRTVGIAEDITKRKEQEKINRESEEKFKNIFYFSNTGIAFADIAGNILDANDEFLQLLGYSRKELIGKNFNIFTHPDDYIKETKIIENMIQNPKNGIKYRMDKRYITRNGDIKWVNLSVSSIHDSQGKPVFVVGTVIDITDKKQYQINVEENEEKYRSLVEQLSDMVLLVDMNGQIIEVNNATVHHTGYTKNELLKMNIFDIDLDAKDRDDKKRYWQSLKPEDPALFFESRHKRKDGTCYDVEISMAKICFNNQNFILGLARDITKRKENEENLRISEENYRTIFNNSTDSIFVHDYKNGNIIDVNQTTIDTFGYTKEEITNLNVGDISFNKPPYTQKEAFQWIQKAAKEGPQKFEWLVKNRKRDLIWFENTVQLVTIFGEKRVLVMGRNITEEKNARQRLRDSEEKFRSLIEQSSDMLFLHNTKGQLIEVNNAAVKHTGYSRNELLKMTVFDIDPDAKDRNDMEIYWRSLQQYDKPVTFEGRHRRKDGCVYDAEITVSKISLQNGEFVLGLARDITERKKAELILKESEEKFRSLVDQAAEMLFLHDLDGNIIDVNKAAVKNTGFKREELLKMTINDIDIDTGDRDYKNDYWGSMKPEDEPIALEVQHKRRDGTIYPAEVTISKVVLSDGEYILALAKDITERKQTEEILKKSEAKYRLLFNSVPTGVGIACLDGTILQANDVFCNMLGYGREDFSKINIKDLYLYPDQREEFLSILKENRSVRDYEVEIRKKNGTIGIFLLNCDIISFNDEQVLLTSGKEITSLIETQKELRQAHNELILLNKTLETKVDERTTEVKRLLQQKDEFINQMGHDLKNPIGPFVQLLPILRNHVSNDKDKEIIDVLYRNACYMRNLVKKTIDLAKLNSRKTTFTFEDVSLKDILDEVIFTNKSMFEENDIIVENNLSSTLEACVDSFYIQELLTNLLNNSVKYTNGSGKITINADIDNDNIVVSVKDTGIGISEQQMRFLFDEYYKADSSRHDFESSGLGLPICKRIVERHNGCIWATSDGLGKGSTFYFTLPLVQTK